MPDTSIRIAVFCETPQEAEVAFNAIEEYRLTGAGGRSEATVSDRPSSTLVDFLVQGLDHSPLNPVKERVLQTLLAAPAGKWVPYADLGEAVKDLCDSPGSARNRAGAAIRDLSWQIAQVTPTALVAKVSTAVELMMDRTRTGGEISYRLTQDGRAAVERFLGL